MSVATDRPLRIGEVAMAVGTTARTIRYYEELGLLGSATDRPAGAHRTYGPADVDRLREIMRLRDLLGVSLDELQEIVEAVEARAALRVEFERSHDDARRQEILVEALGHIDRQLELVRRRVAELDGLEQELTARRRRVKTLLRVPT
jgi:DNA-binding transcriptional MerR regulator